MVNGNRHPTYLVAQEESGPQAGTSEPGPHPTRRAPLGLTRGRMARTPGRAHKRSGGHQTTGSCRRTLPRRRPRVPRGGGLSSHTDHRYPKGGTPQRSQEERAPVPPATNSREAGPAAAARAPSLPHQPRHDQEEYTDREWPTQQVAAQEPEVQSQPFGGPPARLGAQPQSQIPPLREGYRWAQVPAQDPDPQASWGSYAWGYTQETPTLGRDPAADTGAGARADMQTAGGFGEDRHSQDTGTQRWASQAPQAQLTPRAETTSGQATGLRPAHQRYQAQGEGASQPRTDTTRGDRSSAAPSLRSSQEGVDLDHPMQGKHQVPLQGPCQQGEREERRARMHTISLELELAQLKIKEQEDSARSRTGSRRRWNSDFRKRDSDERVD
jgi:hypothetical protein